jgi:hypothetical protein
MLWRRTVVDARKVQALFTKYKDDGDDTLSIQGVLALAGDLGFEMTDLRVTILLAYINFVKLTSTKVDFLKGLTELRCDSEAAMKSALTELQRCIDSDTQLFKRVFEYSYVGNLEVCMAICTPMEDATACLTTRSLAARPEGPENGNCHHAVARDAGLTVGAGRRLCGFFVIYGSGSREQGHMEDASALYGCAA